MWPAGGQAAMSSTASAVQSPMTSTRPGILREFVALRARTRAIARHLTEFLKKTDRFAKTMVFCVDQEHAAEMREALVNLEFIPGVNRAVQPCRVAARHRSALQIGHPNRVFGRSWLLTRPP